MKREKIVVRTGVIGIIANVLLSLFKALVGIFSGSIAILLDAVNNLSDALSSVITIVSTKLAGRKPDKRHPFGHGRLEYISAGLIAIMAAGPEIRRKDLDMAAELSAVFDRLWVAAEGGIPTKIHNGGNQTFTSSLSSAKSSAVASSNGILSCSGGYS